MLNEIDLSRADLNLLVLFEAVMRERHVGRAAERLNLTASAVSHGLKRLRALLDDPLFLKTPRGVVPTQRAEELGPAIADVLARVRNVVATAEPFDPLRSRRRFSIGAPDGIVAALLSPLLVELERTAPGVDIGIRQLLPREGEANMTLAWRDSLMALEERAMDVAILPFGDVPPRFATFGLFSETFAIAARRGHPFLEQPDIEAYCAEKHLVVSHTGDPYGFVDAALATRGLSRRVALTVPNFMFALAALAGSDLVAALPRRFLAMHGEALGISSVPPPLELPSYDVSLVVPRVALMDAGLAWLTGTLTAVAGRGASPAPRP